MHPSKLTITLAILLFSSFSHSRPDASVYANPVTGFVMAGLILMGAIAFFKNFFERPLWVLRQIISVVVAVAVGIAPLMLAFKIDIGLWVGPLWVFSWIVAYKVGMFLSGPDNETKQDAE